MPSLLLYALDTTESIHMHVHLMQQTFYLTVTYVYCIGYVIKVSNIECTLAHHSTYMYLILSSFWLWPDHDNGSSEVGTCHQGAASSSQQEHFQNVDEHSVLFDV